MANRIDASGDDNWVILKETYDGQDVEDAAFPGPPTPIPNAEPRGGDTGTLFSPAPPPPSPATSTDSASVEKRTREAAESKLPTDDSEKAPGKPAPFSLKGGDQVIEVSPTCCDFLKERICCCLPSFFGGKKQTAKSP